MTPPPLLLLLLLPPLGVGARGRDPRGGAEPVAALEALLSSGRGSLPHGAVESLVGIAAGRAQCHAGPCGKCLSAGAVLALAGKTGATARLEATDVPWLGAAVLVTLRDPPATCADVTAGPWATRARALHRAFADAATGATTAANATTTANATVTVAGVPLLRAVAELLAAVQPHYRSADGPEGCVDAAAAVAAGAAVSPRVAAGAGRRALAALGTLLLRGRCLRNPPGPPPGGGWGPPQGLSAPMEQLGLSPPGTPPHADPPLRDPPPEALPHTPARGRLWEAVYVAPPELLRALGVPGGAALSGGQLPPPAATAATTATTATTATAPTGTRQLSTAERYALASVAGLALALCPLLSLALLRCPLCHRAQRWLHPLLVALAAGALSGDALLHLLPQLLGVHDHGGGSQPHGEGSPPPAGGSQLPWPLLGVLGGLYAAFLLERLLGLLPPPRQQGDHAVGRPPGTSSAEPAKVEEGDPEQSPQELQSRGPRALPWMVAAGHAAHGLVDGLALGAAFATSVASGVATALALLCHELPHALGAVAVLAQAAVPGRRAVALALGGALPVLGGLYAGLALGATDVARAWLTAAAAGLLLYLALCHTVPAMVGARAGRPWVLLGLQSAGLLAGWGALLLLALYEGQILR